MMRLLVVAMLFGCGAKAASPGLVVYPSESGDTVVTVRASTEGPVHSDILEILSDFGRTRLGGCLGRSFLYTRAGSLGVGGW